MRFHLTKKSSNRKTGPIPVSTSSPDTCPPSCPFRNNGCYADSGPLRLHWGKVTNGNRGLTWDKFIKQIESLPMGQLWRHNQAGDLAGIDEDIDHCRMRELIAANTGKCGFTYTHKSVIGPAWSANRKAVSAANKGGFTVNLSGHSLTHADKLYDLGIGPVTVVLPADGKNTLTPKGRRVVVCPAQTQDEMTCVKCKACTRANRKAIIGFLAHGNKKKIVSGIVQED